ncbi:MAG: Bax inhibitor-1/YccA family protein [Bacteroidales bacterium]|nr:Bax inhibitor-1/YccA family protein [Bacteroidales bacterium]
MDNYKYPPQYRGNGFSSSAVSVASQALKGVYLRMTFGLLITAIVSWFLSQSTGYITYISTHSWTMWVIIIAEFALLFGIQGALMKLSSPVAAFLFYLFSAVNGAWLAPIFLVYTGTSIAKTFFITAGTFAAMSVYGYTTKQDLTKFGQYLIYALIGLVIAMIVNIFTKSSALDWIISIVGVLLFIGLTAWDTQAIKRMAAQMPASEIGRLATLGALNLYLDFVNLFLFLLRIFGNTRD